MTLKFFEAAIKTLERGSHRPCASVCVVGSYLSIVHSQMLRHEDRGVFMILSKI